MLHGIFQILVYGGLCFFSGIVVTKIFYITKISMWRIRWIDLEYQLAKCQKREARNINIFDKEDE